MNKKSSLKKKSSLLPFLALPAAGALAGGAYYWQQNNGEDAGLSKQEKAKRLLRCLILGGATGLGAATAYTGGKMTYDNLIKDSSYKKKVTKSASKKRSLLKQLVKKSSKKRNLLKLLVKQAAEPIQIPEYDGNINSNYLIGGGLGLLGGLGLYHFLNNEEAKKKGLGGYIGAGLTGLSAGLLGAGAYNQTQHGKLFDEKNENAGMYFTPEDPANPLKSTDSTQEFDKVIYKGRRGYIGSKPGVYRQHPVKPSGGGTSEEDGTTLAGAAWDGAKNLGSAAYNNPAATYGISLGLAVGAGLTDGAVRNLGNNIVSPSNPTAMQKLEQHRVARDRMKDRSLRPQGFDYNGFTHPFRRMLDIATSPHQYLYRVTRNNTTNNRDSNLLLPSNVVGLLENPQVQHFLGEKPTADQVTKFNEFNASQDPQHQWIPEASDIPLDKPNPKRFAEPGDFDGIGSTERIKLVDWLNKRIILERLGELVGDPSVFENDVKLAQEAYDNIAKNHTYGELGYPKTSLQQWKYTPGANLDDLAAAAEDWKDVANWTEDNRVEKLENILKYKDSLPDAIVEQLANYSSTPQGEVKRLTEAQAKNIQNSQYGAVFQDAVDKLKTARENYWNLLQNGASATEIQEAQKNLLDAYDHAQKVNKGFRDTFDFGTGRGIRPEMYLDPVWEGFPESDVSDLQKQHDLYQRKLDTADNYNLKKNEFLKNNFDARLQNLKAQHPELSDADVLKMLSEDTTLGTPKAIQDIAKKELKKELRNSRRPLFTRMSELWNNIFSAGKSNGQDPGNVPPEVAPIDPVVEDTMLDEGSYNELEELLEKMKDVEKQNESSNPLEENRSGENTNLNEQDSSKQTEQKPDPRELEDQEMRKLFEELDRLFEKENITPTPEEPPVDTDPIKEPPVGSDPVKELHDKVNRFSENTTVGSQLRDQLFRLELTASTLPPEEFQRQLNEFNSKIDILSQAVDKVEKLYQGAKTESAKQLLNGIKSGLYFIDPAESLESIQKQVDSAWNEYNRRIQEMSANELQNKTEPIIEEQNKQPNSTKEQTSPINDLKSINQRIDELTAEHDRLQQFSNDPDTANKRVELIKEIKELRRLRSKLPGFEAENPAYLSNSERKTLNLFRREPLNGTNGKIEPTEKAPVKAPEGNPNTQGTSETQKGTETVQPKRVKSKQDIINGALSKLEPTPGSHFDENWRTVVDDPIVYQKELEKELARIDKKLETPDKVDIAKRKELDIRRSWLQKFLKGLEERAIRVGEALVEGGKRFNEGVKHK